MTYAFPKFDDYSGANDNAKMTALLAASDPVVILDRSISLSQTFKPRSGLTLMGLGWAASIIHKTNAGDLWSCASGDNIEAFKIKNMSLWGDDAAGNCFSLEGAKECEIEGNLIKNFKGHAIYMYGTNSMHNLTRRNRIGCSAYAPSGQRGIYVYGGNCIRSEHDYVDGYETGMDFSGGGQIIQQPTIENATNSFYLGGDGDVAIYGGIINANAIGQKKLIQAASNDGLYCAFVRNLYSGDVTLNNSSVATMFYNPA